MAGEPQPKFKSGDSVRLKAGGPKMTVDSIYVNRSTKAVTYTCKWFAGSKLNGAQFEEGAIQTYDDDEDDKDDE